MNLKEKAYSTVSVQNNDVKASRNIKLQSAIHVYTLTRARSVQALLHRTNTTVVVQNSAIVRLAGTPPTWQIFCASTGRIVPLILSDISPLSMNSIYRIDHSH